MLHYSNWIKHVYKTKQAYIPHDSIWHKLPWSTCRRLNINKVLSVVDPITSHLCIKAARFTNVGNDLAAIVTTNDSVPIIGGVRIVILIPEDLSYFRSYCMQELTILDKELIIDFITNTLR